MGLSGFGRGNEHMQEIVWVAVTIAFLQSRLLMWAFWEWVK